MMDKIALFLLGLLNILPNSPFKHMADSIEGLDYLGFLNWFIPFDVCLIMLETWLISMAAYLIYKLIRDRIHKIL